MQMLAEWILGISGFDSAADLRGDVSDFAPGSRNLIPDGVKQSRPFRGLTAIGTGGRQMFQVKDTWGSLDDDGATQGKGSLFASVADMLVYVGQGKVRLESTWLGVTASNQLKFLLKWNGSYTDPKSGPYAAGLPEPLAPTVGIATNASIYGTPNLTGTASIKNARLRTTTGGRSRASATSDVLTLNANAVYAVCPAIVTGQTHHVFFVTDTKLGGIGLHYRLARANPFTGTEYTEADVERTVAITSVSGGDTLHAPSGTFTAGDIAKLVENISGYTVPAGTTVAEIIDSSSVRLSAAITGSGAGSVNLVSYVNSIRRAVILNWVQSDTIEEVAWVYDFPPPTGSHAFQLESRMFLCSLADATARATSSAATPDDSASASTPGTALIGSVSDQFESFDPRYPVYLPETVIDILSDGMESYKFVGGKNGVYAAQYLNVTNSAPLTLSVLLRGEGIQTPDNWCARDRAIYLYTGKGRPVRIIEGGNVDKTFAAKVRREMRNIDQADMKVFSHPLGGGVVYAAGSRAWFFDEVTGRWSTELGLNDQFAGSALSAVSTQSRSILTLNNGGTFTAYYFDEGSGSYVTGVGHYQAAPAPTQPKNIQRVTAAGEVDRIDTNVWLGIHANTLPTHMIDVAMTSGSNYLDSALASFTSDLVGAYVLVRGASSTAPWLFGRVKSIVSPTRLAIGTPTADLSRSVDLNATVTVANAYTLIGLRIFPLAPNRKGTFEIESGEMFIPGITSYAVSMAMDTTGVAAQPLRIGLEGEVNQEEGWGFPSSEFNKIL